MEKTMHRIPKARVYSRKHPSDKDKATRTSYELSSHRFGLNGQARRYGFDSEELKLSWEEIEAIPCVTERISKWRKWKYMDCLEKEIQ